MVVELDDIDRRILEWLLRDGRAPASQIAESVGLSRPAVAERIEKLERSGVVRGTTVVLDPATIGAHVTAFVSARAPGLVGTRARKAFDALLLRPEILEAHTVAGDDCYLLKVRTESMAALNALVSSLTAAPLSLTTRTTIVMQTHCEKVGGVTLGERG